MMMIMQLFHKSTTDTHTYTHNFCFSQLSLIETIFPLLFSITIYFSFEYLPFIITVRPFDSLSSPFSRADDVVDGDLLLFPLLKKLFLAIVVDLPPPPPSSSPSFVAIMMI